MRALVVLGLLGCGGGETGAGLDRDDPAAAADLTGYRGVFEIRWDNQPVGEARERMDPAPGGYRFERRETWQVGRGSTLVAGELSIAIETTAGLEPTRVEVRGSGATGTARREGEGWRIEVAGEAPRTGRGLPLELLPLVMAGRRLERWSGPVLLPGLGFAPASASVEPDGERGRLVQISGPAGSLSVRISLRPDGTIERAVGPDLSAHRVATAARPRPPDLVALGGLEVAGEPSSAIELETRAGRLVALSADLPRCAPGCSLAVPDPPPSPAIRRLADRLAAGARSPADQLARLARATADLLADDLAAGAEASAARALADGRADCVGHAALFSALARARGLSVRLVTGFRLDGRRLVRHAWAIASVGGRSLAFDPSTGEPALGGRYLPLAVHGSAAGEIGLAAELAYAGLSGARARFIDPRSARSTPRTP